MNNIGRGHVWSSSARGVGSKAFPAETTITHVGAAVSSECPEYAGTAAPTYSQAEPGVAFPSPRLCARGWASILENDTRGATATGGPSGITSFGLARVVAPTNPATERGATPGPGCFLPNAQAPDSCANSRPAGFNLRRASF
jgi:hypothetical protein